MEDKERAKIARDKLKVHPKEKSKILSFLPFCWQLPIFLRGWRSELTEDDLYAPLKDHSSKKLGDKLEDLWNEELKRKNPSLAKAVIRLVRRRFLIVAFVYFPLETILSVLQPWFLNSLLYFYTPQETEGKRQQAYFDALVLTLLFIGRVFVFNWYNFQQLILGIKTRTAVSSLIYRKCLTLKKEGFQKTTVGQIVNLLSTDVFRFEFAFALVHVLWMGPLGLVIGSVYLDLKFGHAALSGVTALLLCLILQIYMAKKFAQCRFRTAQRTDYRIRLMDDILSGIQTIKMYSWEKPFSELLQAARNLEIKDVGFSTKLRLMNNTFKLYVTRICLFIVVMTTVLTGLSLNPQNIFSVSCFFQNITTVIVLHLPMAVIYVSETRASIRRIQAFLLNDHHKPNLSNLILEKGVKSKTGFVFRPSDAFRYKLPGIFMDNVSVAWDPSSHHTLKNVNFVAQPGELVVVIGAAGSGKSTLLQTILQEVNIVGGTINVGGTISYASQEPWIFSGSIKQNILFGEDFDPSKYEKVIEMCSLKYDFSLLAYGDQTLVGERGVMLSGGQKARVNLARAIYRDADVYLLDDPLSAVDAAVARNIFESCVLNYLSQKCVILVTHQFQYLRNVDKIYFSEFGTLAETPNFEGIANFEEEHHKPPTVDFQMSEEIPKEEKEHRSTTANTKKIYKSYCTSAGRWPVTLLILFAFFFAQAIGNLADFYVAFWVNFEQNEYNLGEKFNAFFTENCTYIYIATMVVMMVTNHLASFGFSLYCTRAAGTLYNNMSEKILHATMGFFNNHSSGRILNRFSKDTGIVDEILPMTLTNGITAFLTIFGIIVTIVAMNYWMVVPTIVLILIIVFYSTVYKPTNRNNKRTDGITRSYVLSHLSASLQGLTTIRAFNSQKTLIEEFDNYQDLNISSTFNYFAMFAAFGFWTDLTCAIYSGAVTFSFFLLGSGTYGGNVGLAISLSISLMGLLQHGMKTLGELDAHMTSVERMVEYADLAPEESSGKIAPPESWPSCGDLQYDSVSLQYSPTKPQVLKNVSFQIKSGEKIGIIGRTGAGKTSLLSTLFHLFHFEGRILIDGVDTKTVPLSTLRSQISIIPQDPVLFLGTLRKNLDPFDEISDEQLWKTLNDMGLRRMVLNLPSGLDSIISEKGSNLSVGERQLLCLVRAMLKNTKIVVLDEATANVDLQTDELIQSTIRKKFVECTVLTIAHRLHTVIDSDKILVMENGSVVEFGCPKELLQNTESVFFGYVKRNGDKVMQELMKIANVLPEDETKSSTLEVSEL